jgi:hypothetical protein
MNAEADRRGFLIDHWHYNLDLIESYLSVIPENAKEVFFCKKSSHTSITMRGPAAPRPNMSLQRSPETVEVGHHDERKRKMFAARTAFPARGKSDSGR